MNLGSSHQSCMWPCAESSSKAGEKNKTDIQRQMGMCVGRGGWEREGGRERDYVEHIDGSVISEVQPRSCP